MSNSSEFPKPAYEWKEGNVYDRDGREILQQGWLRFRDLKPRYKADGEPETVEEWFARLEAAHVRRTDPLPKSSVGLTSIIRKGWVEPRSYQIRPGGDVVECIPRPEHEHRELQKRLKALRDDTFLDL